MHSGNLFFFLTIHLQLSPTIRGRIGTREAHELQKSTYFFPIKMHWGRGRQVILCITHF